MVYGSTVLRIFWPQDALHSSKEGVIVGWRNTETDLVVVAVLDNVEARIVDNALSVGHLFRNSGYPISRIFDLCGHSPISVLGTTNGPIPSSFSLSKLCVCTGRKVLPIIWCPNTLGITVQLVMYHKPSPYKLQFLSLAPISLALGDKIELESVNEEQAYLTEKMKLHTVIKRIATEKELMIPRILGQINCSQELTDLMLKNMHLIRSLAKRKMSVSERVVESANSLWDILYLWFTTLWSVYIWPVVTNLFKNWLVCHRFVAEVVLQVLEWRSRTDSAALKDISATAQQIDIRLQQFCYWPLQYLKLRKKRDDWKSITDSHPDYIRFYNSLWLVANDVIIGIALGSFIVDNSDWLASFIDGILSDWTLLGLKSIIEWLTDWPAGLKLNTELAKFMADLVLWVIQYWSYLLMIVRPFLPHIIYVIGFSSFAGATLPIAMFSDLLDILTMHIHGCYITSARIFHWQLSVITSLFHLFRGKKNNVLRNRIDSCEYDLDQLLLGTILFTLLVFLLPTVMVFYFTFALSRMAIITLTALLETALAFLNHFPLFALMLRIKDSGRLPGGIAFDLQDNPASLGLIDSHHVPQTSYVIVQSVPLSVRQIFDQYFQLSARLRGHYFAPSIIMRLLTGQSIPPIPRRSLYSLQYSMLPARRFSVAEMWKQLNESSTKKDPALVSNGQAKIPNGAHLNLRRSDRRIVPP